ncbi:unnamed protein product [Sphagnum troendelagicum]|uniref:Uncharacterized protein n=1 Tax=Sphagnum troendelagicum TaxID=128251 RepID=A0ABP0UYJ7_9BRYO
MMMAKRNGDTSLSEVQEMILQPLDVNNGDVDGESALMTREEFLVQESTEIVDEEPCLSQRVQQVEAISERRQGDIISEFVGEVGKPKAQTAEAAGGRKMEEGEKLHCFTVNQIVALESENLQLTNELNAFHLQLETAAQQRIEFFTEIENLKAQTRMIGDEREHLLSVVEASESRADQLATEIVRCKKQFEVDRNEERSRLAKQLKIHVQSLALEKHASICMMEDMLHKQDSQRLEKEEEEDNNKEYVLNSDESRPSMVDLLWNAQLIAAEEAEDRHETECLEQTSELQALQGQLQVASSGDDTFLAFECRKLQEKGAGEITSSLPLMEDSDECLQQLNSEKKLLVTQLDDSYQSQQEVLRENRQLAIEINKQQEERERQEERILQHEKEVVTLHVQIQTSAEKEIHLVSKLAECTKERADEKLVSVSKGKELQLQVQRLREENAELVVKASQLNQMLEEANSEKIGFVRGLEEMVQNRQLRENEVAEEFETWREHIQSLETEKMKGLSLIEDLNSQLQSLGKENAELATLSSESQQALKELWEENARLVAEVSNLAWEKQRQEGEKLDLMAGIQTVWEQLKAAHEHEAFLSSELSEHLKNQVKEKAMFVTEVQELQQQLKKVSDENALSVSQSHETSQALQDLHLEKEHLVTEIASLVQEKHRREEAIAGELITWKEQVQGLIAENLKSTSVIEDLNQQLQKSGAEIKQLTIRVLEFSGSVNELHTENGRLASEVDKLEEIKERQEGERLELAAKLQAAWVEIQALGEHNSLLTSDLKALREERDKEKLKASAEVQELGQQIQGLTEQNELLHSTVKDLTQRLEELCREKELQEENMVLTVKIAELEQDRARANAEGVELHAVSSKLKLRVQSLEHDKAKLLSEIEELNRWLQRPAAEKKHLANKLDEVSCAMQGLQLENSQLISQISKLEKEVHQRQEENQILSYRVLSLEEEIKHVISELTATNLEQKQMKEGKQLVDTLLEDSRLLVQELRQQNDSLNSDILMLMEEKGNMMSDLRVLQQQMQEVTRNSEEKSKVFTEIGFERDQYRDLVRMVELQKLWLGMEIEELKETLHQVNQEKRELVMNLCQELSKLLRTVAEEKDKVAREQCLSHEKTEMVTVLCQELDGLLWRLGEQKHRVVDQLSNLQQQMLHSSDGKTVHANELEFEPEVFRQQNFLLEFQRENSEREVEASKPKVQAVVEERLARNDEVQDMEESVGVLKQNRDTATCVEESSTLELDALSMHLTDADSKMAMLGPLVKQLWADYMTLKQQNWKLTQKLVRVAKNLEAADVKAAQNSSLAIELNDIPDRFIERLLQGESDEASTVFAKTDLLGESLQKSIHTTFPDLQFKWDLSTDFLSQLTHASNAKERLSVTFSRGQSYDQQQDGLDQLLSGKTKELEHVISTHSEALKTKDLPLNEAELKISSLGAAIAGHVSSLELELTTIQSSSASVEQALHDNEAAIKELRASKRQLEQDRDNFAFQLETLSGKYLIVEEFAAQEGLEKAKLQSEISKLQETALEQLGALHAADAMHCKLQSYIDCMVVRVVNTVHEVLQGQGIAMEPTNITDVEAAVTMLVEKHKTSILEVQKLAQQVETMEEMLASRDLEISGLSKTLEEAVLTMTQQDDEIEGLVQQSHRLKTELAGTVKMLQEAHERILAMENRTASSELELEDMKCDVHLVPNELVVLRQGSESLNLELSKEKAENVLVVEYSQSTSEGDRLRGECLKLSTDLAESRRDKEALETKLHQVEHKLWSVRDKLGLAVKKGKGLEKQRDVLRQSLEEKAIVMDLKVAKYKQAFESMDAEVCNMRRREEQLLEERHLFIRTLEGALAQSSWPDNVKAMEPTDIIDWLAMEYAHAKETISTWMRRCKEVENQATLDHMRYEKELGFHLQVIREAEIQTNVLSEKVEEMEQVLQKLQVSTNSMDSSRTKQFSKFTSTVKRLSELQQQTEVQPPEVKGHHCDIETQDTQIPRPAEILMADMQREDYSWAIMNANTEIVQLTEELDTMSCKVNAEITGLREDMLVVQKSPDIKNSELNGIQSKLAAMVCNQDISKGTFAEDDFDEVELQTADLHTEKLQAEVRSLVHPSGADTFCIEASDTEESEKPRGMWVAAVNSAAPHVRSSRKPLLGDIAIGVLSGEPSNLILDLDDKGHGIKTSGNSRVVPNAVQSVVDRLDTLWVGGGRMLMQQPIVRLGLGVYCILLHLWILMLLSRAYF